MQLYYYYVIYVKGFFMSRNINELLKQVLQRGDLAIPRVEL